MEGLKLKSEPVHSNVIEVQKLLHELSPAEKARVDLIVNSMSLRRPIVFVLATALNWSVIFLTIGLSVAFLPTFLKPLALFIIASRQHALLVLMHDGCHLSFMKNQRLSDLFTNFFCAYPMLITTENFRLTHLKHHRFLNSANDPDLNVKKESKSDWTFPKTYGSLLWLLAREALGGSVIFMLRKLMRFSVKNSRNNLGRRNSNISLRIIYISCVLFLFYSLGQTDIFLFYWLAPALLILPIMLRLRSIGDHFGLPGNHELNVTRNLILPSWQKFFFAPHNIGIHVVHHLYPNVPYYNLMKLHRELNKFSAYKQKAHNTYNIFSVSKNGLIFDLNKIQTRLNME